MPVTFHIHFILERLLRWLWLTLLKLIYNAWAVGSRVYTDIIFVFHVI